MKLRSLSPGARSSGRRCPRRRCRPRARDRVAVIAAQQVAQVERAVRDVDLRRGEVALLERGAARQVRDVLRRLGRDLHEPARAGVRRRVAEARLGVDHRRQQERIELLGPRLLADDVLVGERQRELAHDVGQARHDDAPRSAASSATPSVSVTRRRRRRRNATRERRADWSGVMIGRALIGLLNSRARRTARFRAARASRCCHGVRRPAGLLLLRKLPRGAFVDADMAAGGRPLRTHGLVRDHGDRRVVDAVHAGLEEQRRLDDRGGRRPDRARRPPRARPRSALRRGARSHPRAIPDPRASRTRAWRSPRGRPRRRARPSAPQRATTASRSSGVAYSSCTTASVDSVAAPSRSSAASAVDLPAPRPPVRPTKGTLPDTARQLAAGSSASGSAASAASALGRRPRPRSPPASAVPATSSASSAASAAPSASGSSAAAASARRRASASGARGGRRSPAKTSSLRPSSGTLSRSPAPCSSAPSSSSRLELLGRQDLRLEDLALDALDAQRQAAALGVDLEDLHLDLVARGDDLARVLDVVRRELGDVHEALDAVEDLDEGAERDDLRDRALELVTDVVRVDDALPRILLGLLETEARCAGAHGLYRAPSQRRCRRSRGSRSGG